MTASKSIRLKCLDCSGESPKEVTLCTITSCALWPKRMGTGKIAAKRFKDIQARCPEEFETAKEAADDQAKFITGF